MDKKLLGSQTAKGGFQNERDIVQKFENWKQDTEAQTWLEIMGYDLNKLDKVNAVVIPTRIKKANATKYNVSEEEYEKFVRFKKADIQIQLVILIGNIFKIENISLKKYNANAKADFNQIDNYQEMWNFDDEISLWLKLFSGELLPKNYKNLIGDISLREDKRMFINEMPINIQEKIMDFFDKNRIIIANDVLRGRGGLAADWILVTRKNIDDTTTWILKDINTAMNFYGSGEVKISPKGSISIGNFFLQRKGGTPDPTKLQFKFSPCDLFNLQ